MPSITRSALRAAAIVGASSLALVGGAAAAVAQDTPEYPPTTPSSASAVCIGDIPYFSFTVDFGPDFAGQTLTITLANPEGDDFVYTRTLDSNGRLSGNDILWPGASENPPDWPGWVLDETGNWVEADDGFLWARGTITVTFEVNPTQVIQVSYPPATSVCANPPTGDTPPPDNPEVPPTTTTSTPGLPATGAQTATLAAVGGGLLLGGTALVVGSRRRATRTSV
jgi:LPXTG-motif cell wall-anchored protein